MFATDVNKYNDFVGINPDIIIILQDQSNNWTRDDDENLPKYENFFFSVILPIIQVRKIEVYVIQEQFAQISYWKERDKRERKEDEIKTYEVNKPAEKEFFSGGKWVSV